MLKRCQEEHLSNSLFLFIIPFDVKHYFHPQLTFHFHLKKQPNQPSAPSSVDAPKFSFTGARRAVVELSPPAKPNGIITEYKIYLNNTLINTTRGDEREIAIANLKPYADYVLYFEACTSVGCTNSPRVEFRTLQDGMCYRLYICLYNDVLDLKKYLKDWCSLSKKARLS